MLIKGNRFVFILSFLLTSLYIVLERSALLEIRPLVYKPTRLTDRQSNSTISRPTTTDGLYAEGTNSSIDPSVHVISTITSVNGSLQESTWIEDARIPYVRLRDKDTDINFRCSSCAIVTSSGHVLGSRKGVEIDSKECVFRMNDAPIEGYQRDVGTRTTIRVIAFISFKLQRNLIKAFKLRARNITYIVWGPWKLMKSGNRDFMGIKRFADRTKGNWLIFDRKKMEQMDALYEKETGESRERSGAWLSTGWFTLNVAKEMCGDIHVYGMPPDNYCRRTPTSRVLYHYYNPTGPKQCSYYQSTQRQRFGHRFLTEKNIFRGWAKKYNIHFHAPKW